MDVLGCRDCRGWRRLKLNKKKEREKESSEWRYKLCGNFCSLRGVGLFERDGKWKVVGLCSRDETRSTRGKESGRGREKLESNKKLKKAKRKSEIYSVLSPRVPYQPSGW